MASNPISPIPPPPPRRCRSRRKLPHDGKHSGYRTPVKFGRRLRRSDVTARKLAAGLWQLRFMDVSAADAFCPPSSTCQLANGNVKITFPHSLNSREKLKDTKDPLHKPVTILRSRNGLLCELVSSMQCLKSPKEEATKWDPALAEPPFNDFTKIHRKKHFDDRRKLAGNCDHSIVAALLQQLLRAQRSIEKLKAAHKSSKQKVEQFLHDLREEKASWKHRERKKIESVLDDLKDKLAWERRSRERMELLNAKLVHELAQANSSSKQFMANYEKEKKERELLEEVCNQLSMQIGEDRGKLEGLLMDSLKIGQEVEEERKMMQLAELWREERVQMKLDDAKLLLEDKHNQMINLIAYLQMFLKSRGAELGTAELEDAESIKKAVESVNIQRIVELSYDFSKADEEFLMLEELTKDNHGERVIRPFHNESIDEENKHSASHQPSPSRDHNTALKLTNSSETVGDHVEGHHKFNSSPPQRRDTNLLINVKKQGKKNILGSEAKKCSDLKACQSKWKDYPASKIIRPCPNGGTTSSSAKAFQHKRARETAMNPHICRGMKGCIEWPRGTPKANSKVIPLEERVRSQKSQVQHMLKPKA